MATSPSSLVDENPAKKAKSVHSGPPPVYSSIEELAHGSQANESRYKSLVTAFESKYGSKPSYLTRAPGRVNLIGEHVDYSGYGVLPMAIEQDIAIACRPNDTGELRFSNTNPSQYPDHTCSVADFPIDRKLIVWYSYLLCGIKGMIEELGVKDPVGFDMLVNGSIPPASGLSSSSALVCCAALAFLCANNVDLPSKKDLAEMCARSEHHIGTQGGGMDQAISFLGQPGKALMIEFNPVRPSEVNLPDGYSFIISNTMVTAIKAAQSYFNTRVAEVHIAARVIAKKRDLDWRKVNRLSILADSLGVPLREMSSVVTQNLHPEPYTRDEICHLLEIDDKELTAECLTEKSKKVKSFKLYERAKHVYEEANRVYEFNSTANAVGGGDPNSSPSPAETAKDLGKLMDSSHSSCRDDYDCSCAELDTLTALSKESGALGSRLTGAGWGGCAVSLVANDDVESFLRKLTEGYYKGKGKNGNLLLTNILFATQPGPGAGIYKL